MKAFRSITYMNESLLDEVEVDKVADEDGPVAEYTFMFYFNSDNNPKIVINTFFGSAIEPALDMMKSRGLLDSWEIDKSIGRVIDFPVIDLFMDCMYNKSASASDTFSFVLSFVVRFLESEESTEFLGTVSAVLMQYVLASRISMDGNMMESFWRTGGDGQVYCVFYDIDKRRIKSGDGEKWAFHCGKDCVNSVDLCGTFAGCFVRNAGKLGFMKPVDDDGKRYVVYGFGKNAGGQRMYFMASDGTCLNNFIVILAAAANGRFLDNGLMHVDFNGRYANYLRMDGTLWLNLDYRCGDRFSEGYVPVLRIYPNGSVESNLLDIDRNPLLNEWYVRTEGFVDGLAIVVRKAGSGRGNKIEHNVVDVEGNLIFGEWYEEVRFEDIDGEPDAGCKRTVARVRKSKEGNGSFVWNYVDRTGKLLFNEWLEGHCSCMMNGFARLSKRVNGQTLYNYMREDGSLVSDEWFDDVSGWPECGVFAIKNNDDLWQFIGTDTGDAMFGGCVFSRIDETVAADGFKYYVVRTVEGHGDDKKMYCDLVSADGRMCCENMDMLNLQYVGNGFVLASKSFFNKELWKFGEGPVKFGRVVSHACRLGDSEYTVVTSDDKYAVVDRNGKPVYDGWFDRVGDNIFGGFVEVWSYGDDRNSVRMNILACRTGKLLFGSGENAACWICGAVPDKVVFVEKWESVMKYNAFDCEGNRLLEKWTDFCISYTEDGGLIRVGPSSLVDCSGKPVCLI